MSLETLNQVSGSMEAVTAAMARVDSLWNMFLTVHLGIGGLALTVAGEKIRIVWSRSAGLAAIVLLASYLAFLFINYTGIADAYRLLIGMFDLFRGLITADAVTASLPDAQGIVRYLDVDPWTTGNPLLNRRLTPIFTHSIAGTIVCGAGTMFVLRLRRHARDRSGADRVASGQVA